MLGNTFSWPTRFSNFSSTNDSITSPNLGRAKTRNFLRRNAAFELKTNYCFFSHTRATQTSDLFVKAIEFLEQLFDKLRCHFCCTYAVSSSAHYQEEELRFRQGKELAVQLLFSRLRGLITLYTKVHKVI